MKEAFIEKNFRDDTLTLIYTCDQIVESYRADGYDLSLRQLYYQLVSKNIIPNKQSEYSRLGAIITDARMAGLIDWNTIVDRTRTLRGWQDDISPGVALRALGRNFQVNLWKDQPCYLEVWVEKEALLDVVRRASMTWRAPYFACKGYASASAMYRAAQRFANALDEDKEPIIVHLGDHDPSGIDMTRDISDRLGAFMAETDVQRVALNIDQVRAYNLPPNPAKLTDSRASGYIEEFGRGSWELDALEPGTLVTLIETTIEQYVDKDLWNAQRDEEALNRQRIAALAATFEE